MELELSGKFKDEFLRIKGSIPDNLNHLVSDCIEVLDTKNINIHSYRHVKSEINDRNGFKYVSKVMYDKNKQETLWVYSSFIADTRLESNLRAVVSGIGLFNR